MEKRIMKLYLYLSINSIILISCIPIMLYGLRENNILIVIEGLVFFVTGIHMLKANGYKCFCKQKICLMKNLKKD